MRSFFWIITGQTGIFKAILSFKSGVCVPLLYLTDYILYQNAALPLLAAPAQTWKPTFANINGSVITAAAASAQIHLG